MTDVDRVIFSIVIPCYNSEKTILRAVESCFKQTYKLIEVLVVNDCSTDKTLKILNGSIFNEFNNFKVFNMEKNAGPSFCRNYGWDQANGKYIAFLDADDLWCKSKLSTILSFLEETQCSLLGHSYSDKVGGFKDHIDKYMFNVKEISFYRLLIKNLSQTSTIVVKSSLVERFDCSMKYSEDYDLWLRIAFNHKVIYLEGPALTLLARPQLTQGGLSGNRWKMRLGEFKVYLKSSKYSFFSKIFLVFLLGYSIAKYLRSEFILRFFKV